MQFATEPVFTKDQLFYTTTRVGNDPERLNARHEIFLRPAAQTLHGARVLDLACHNGRWSYAALRLGAAHVLGVDHDARLVEVARTALASEFEAGRLQLEHDDVIGHLRKLEPGQIDVILCLGLLYHMLSQPELLHQCRRLQPQLLIVDSSVADTSAMSALKSSVRFPTLLDRSVDYTAQGGAFAIAGLRRDGRWELLPNARLLELWLEDAGFQPERLPVPAGITGGGVYDYECGLRVAYHCRPKTA